MVFITFRSFVAGTETLHSVCFLSVHFWCRNYYRTVYLVTCPICKNGTGSDLTNGVVTIPNLIFCHPRTLCKEHIEVFAVCTFVVYCCKRSRFASDWTSIQKRVSVCVTIGVNLWSLKTNDTSNSRCFHSMPHTNINQHVMTLWINMGLSAEQLLRMFICSLI